MKKILAFCLCAFAFVGCTSDGFKDVLQAFNELTTPTQGYSSTSSPTTSRASANATSSPDYTAGGIYSDSDSVAIEKALNTYYELFLKGDLKKCAEYWQFKTDFGKKYWYEYFYKNVEREKDKIRYNGGIESREVMVVTKSKDGNQASAQIVTKYKNGEIITSTPIRMDKVNSKWLMFYNF